MTRPKQITQEGAASSQVLGWNGSKWSPQDSAINISNPTGFVNRTDSTISRNDAAPRLFTIAPAVTSYDFYANGVKYTKNASLTKTWSNTEGLHYFYFDDTGTLQETTVYSNDLILKYCIIAILYWDAVNAASIMFCDERHGYIMSNQTHLHLHLTMGCQWVSGLGLTGITADGDGSNNSHAQLAVDSSVTGLVRDEDLEVTIPGTSGQVLTPAANARIPIYWRTGASGDWRKKTADAYPCLYSGSGGYIGANARIAYNQYTGGAWQLTEAGQGRCVLMHYFGTNNAAEPFIGILGQSVHASVTDARNAAETELASILYGSLPSVEFTPIGSVIFQTSTTYSNAPHARIRSIDVSTTWMDFRAHKFVGTAAGTVTPTSNIGLIQSFSALTADADPDDKTFRISASADYLYCDYLTDNGVNVSTALLALKAGNRIFLQQNDDVSKGYLFRVTGTPVDGTGYVKIPVISESTTGSFGDTKKVTFTIMALNVPYPPGYVSDLEFLYSTAARVQIGTGYAREVSNAANLDLAIATLADLAVSGAGGLDTGAEANSTWYSAWLIGKLDGTINTLLSLSSTAPTMPAGYVYKRRIGWARNDASGNIIPFLCRGYGRRRVVTYHNSLRATLNVLAGGKNTSWQTLDISSLLPPTARRVWLEVACDLASTNYAEFRTTGSSVVTDGNGLRVYQPDANAESGHFWLEADASRQIDWRTSTTSDDGLSIWVCGYEEDI